jgi:uroporphyrinogen-III synthase
MRVLVTRPARSGARTAEKLEARGYEPALLPLTSAIHDIEATRAALVSSTGALAVTSSEAIHVLSSLGAALDLHRGRLLFAVGKATADEAAESGFTRVRHSNGDGAELADFVAGQRVLLDDLPLTYLAGVPRASGFEAGLRMHDIPFAAIECYRMEPVEPSETDMLRCFERPVDAILFYSRHTAERFFGLDVINRDMGRLENTRLLCLSETIATIVPYVLRSRVEIAPAPDEDSLLGLLDGDAGPILI